MSDPQSSNMSHINKFVVNSVIFFWIFSNIFRILSSAFDCVDHDLLLQRLEHGFGLLDVVRRWINSFLSDRTQQVAYAGELSTTRPLLFGVPQGSVLGPLLYILYTAELEQVVTRHGMRLHHYADDSQLYIHVTVRTLQWQSSASPRASVKLITGCVPADWDSIQPRRK